jgi:hypothetical protein
MVLATWKVRAVLAAGLVVTAGLASPANGQFRPPSGPPMGGGGGGNLNPPNASPILDSLNAIQVPGRKFRISGHVTDDTPGQCGVTITGAANGVAMCDASGNFDAIYDVATPGAITAVAGDGQLQSVPVQTNLVNNAPTVGNFIAVQGPGNAWTFSGTVGDECPAGLVVTLSGPPGVNGATATVLASGSWSVTVTLAPNTGGFVTATATDWYSLTGSAMTYFGP